MSCCADFLCDTNINCVHLTQLHSSSFFRFIISKRSIRICGNKASEYEPYDEKTKEKS